MNIITIVMPGYGVEFIHRYLGPHKSKVLISRCSAKGRETRRERDANRYGPQSWSFFLENQKIQKEGVCRITFRLFLFSPPFGPLPLSLYFPSSSLLSLTYFSKMDSKEDIYKAGSPVDEKQAYVGTLEQGNYVQSEINELGQKSDEKLNHVMKSRHIAMISIGGVIGTGLFLGTAGSLKAGGPVGLWLGYIIIGSICYAMMQCLGEFLAYLPVPGGHIKLSGRFVSPAMSFSMGYNYVFNWLIVLPGKKYY